MVKEMLCKANTFVGDRMQLACDTVIDITKAVGELLPPKYELGTVVKFLEGQKALFGRRRDARNKMIG